MQISDVFPNGALPLRGDAPDITSQLQQQRKYHQRILRARTVKLWWYPILLIIFGSLVAAIAGLVVAILDQATLNQVALKCIIIAGVGSVASILIFLAVRHLEFGLLLTAIVTTVFFPAMFSVKSLEVYPVLPLLSLLFCVLLFQTAFHMRERVFPSFWAIWPQLGLIVMAFISTIMVQLSWTSSVPHKINNNPIIYDEILGIGIYFIPLIAIMVTTMALTKKDRYIEYIQRAFLILGFIGAAVIIIEFQRIGASIYTFRYSEATIFWMNLKGLAQLTCLVAIVAYTRLLYATLWRMRIFYSVLVAMCLLGVYFTLENSWWLEVAVALAVMTIVYSRRLFLFGCLLLIPLLPLVKMELDKLSTIKSADYNRLIIWLDVLRVWGKQPLLGVGPGDLWAYDQRFTELPQLLRNFNTTGLGVAHNGYLQVLAEMGPIGLFFWLASIAVIATISTKLFRRSYVPKKKSSSLVKLVGLDLACESEKRYDRMLALVGLGLVCGSAVADFFAGGFFLPPRQIASMISIPPILTSWILWGCVIYKDQVWRMACGESKIEDQGLQD